MIILLLFAFISGLITILAPCVWPLLPIILSSSSTGGRAKSLGITLGIMVSFTIFVLSISYLVSLFGFDPDILRLFAVVVIGFLGLSLVIPALSARMEAVVSGFSGKVGGKLGGQRQGFAGGFVTGFSLGIVWSPCAGPILATIATLATTKAVNLGVVLVTIAYVIGVGIPLFFFSWGGNLFITKSRLLNRYTGRIQQIFGVVMVLTAIAIYTNYDKVIQAKLLDAFPSYGNFLVNLESSPTVKKQLDILKGGKYMDIKTKRLLNPIEEVKKKGKSSLPILAKAPEFVGITKWLNTAEPLTMEGLRGKVVLIDFWTYTCINCIRTLPYVTSWYEKYKENGLVVVGVHTPEFEFEKKTENVLSAIKQYKITYPVPQDNDYATWNAFENRYWPAKYLIDKDGNIRYFHFGEGKYEETEKAIRDLLVEAGYLVGEGMTALEDQTPKGRLTPETYLGSLRMDRFASNEEIKEGKQNYTASKLIPTHYFAYSGLWEVKKEFSIASKGGKLELSFNASKVFLVIHPKTANDQVRVYLDGELVDEDSEGGDVSQGIVQVVEPRLYNLIDLNGKSESHRLLLEFLTSGTEIYAFTFG